VSGGDAELVRSWREAAAREPVRAAIADVHRAVAAAVEARGPACWASGRCCRFERAGHRLYVTGLEAAVVLRALGEAPGGRGAPGNRSEGGRPALRVIGSGGRPADPDGACPFVDANRCSIHGIRPLGCRVYFCDRSAERWQRELYERMQERVRAVHDRFGVAYRYREWRTLLGALRRDTEA
jgi:Fe-S-cluster containining protein